MRTGLSQLLASGCFPLSSPPGVPSTQAYLGVQSSPKEHRWKDCGPWESYQVHTGCALYVALPQAAFPGH